MHQYRILRLNLQTSCCFAGEESRGRGGIAESQRRLIIIIWKSVLSFPFEFIQMVVLLWDCCSSTPHLLPGFEPETLL